MHLPSIWSKLLSSTGGPGWQSEHSCCKPGSCSNDAGADVGV